MKKVILITSFISLFFLASCSQQVEKLEQGQEEPEQVITSENRNNSLGASGTIDEVSNLDGVSVETIYQECVRVVVDNAESDLLSGEVFYKNYIHGKNPSFQEEMGGVFQAALIDKDCSSLGEIADSCNAYLNNNLESISDNTFPYYVLKGVSTGEDMCANIEGLGLQGDCTSTFLLGMNIKENQRFDKAKYEEQISEIFLSACEQE